MTTTSQKNPVRPNEPFDKGMVGEKQRFPADENHDDPPDHDDQLIHPGTGGKMPGPDRPQEFPKRKNQDRDPADPALPENTWEK